MQIGILGGNFNPPHLAHVMAAVLFLKANPKAKVWVIPCWRHPFDKSGVAYKHRLAMCKLAFCDLGPRISVKDIERRLGGVSYTSRTLRLLRKRHTQHHFHLILGSDADRQLSKWKDSAWIKKHVPLFVIPRGNKPGHRICLDNISSAQIRQRLASGQTIERLTPISVADYIAQKNLYL